MASLGSHALFTSIKCGYGGRITYVVYGMVHLDIMNKMGEIFSKRQEKSDNNLRISKQCVHTMGGMRKEELK